MYEFLFILPFLIGLTYLMIVVIARFVKWIMGLSDIDKYRIWKGLGTVKTWDSIRETFWEGLLHRKIFRKNPVLGYMHMSLAFGWFLLITAGHIEVILYKKSLVFPFYLPVFYRYYVTEKAGFLMESGFIHLMDLLLLFVLSGLVLAIIKRLYRRIFGLVKTTRLKSGDRIALTSLWLIFPMRLIAESFSAGQYHNGGFITQSLGNFFSSFLPLHVLIFPAWLGYSLVLGFFFVALPNSRYMHIPAEILFIFIRNYGIKLKKRMNTYSLAQVFSCSRCGICLDTCQLNCADINDTQSVYVLKHIRNRDLTDETLFNCFLCGRCQQECPVGIELSNLRITQRIESTLQYNSSYDYLKEGKAQKAGVIYFAGCMTHLTPAIIKSMKMIFQTAGVEYWFLDAEKAPCCGRPLMNIGQFEAARKLINNNQQLILDSGARDLVVSCPICYKVFNEDYFMPDVKVWHHSEYLLKLLKDNRIPSLPSKDRILYHDPCELGRGSGIYEEPRELLSHYGEVIRIPDEKEQSFCCGGSLANIKIQMAERDRIRDKALNKYFRYHPDYLVTSCPLCKKTFSKANVLPVFDLSEMVRRAININLSDKKDKNTPQSCEVIHTPA